MLDGDDASSSSGDSDFGDKVKLHSRLPVANFIVVVFVVVIVVGVVVVFDFVFRDRCLRSFVCAVWLHIHWVVCCVSALAPSRQQHADIFTPHTDTMRSFFAQQDHLGS